MKKLPLFLICFLQLSILYSQTADWDFNYPAQLEYKSSIITTFENDIINTSRLTIIPEYDKIEFQVDSEYTSLELISLHMIRIEKGHYAFLYGLCALCAGLVLFQAIYSGNNWNDPFTDVSSSTISSTFYACVGIPLAISIPIGVKKKKYKKIYEDGKFINY